jgi:cysteine-rich repeat protein
MTSARLHPLLVCAFAAACADPNSDPGIDDAETGGSSTTNSGSSSGAATGTSTSESSPGSADDSTTADVDDSSSSESGAPLGCGDGELDDGEVCDDGNAIDGDGCNLDCIASGTLLGAWILEDDPEQNASPRAVATGPNGSFVIVGGVMRTDLGEGLNGWIRKYREDATVAWTDTYNNDVTDGLDLFSGVDVDDDGEVVVVGSESRPDLGQGANALLRRYDTNGVEQWTVTYNTAVANGDDVPAGVGFDDAGDIYLGGYVLRPDLGQSADYWVARYTPGGAASWMTTLDSPAHAADTCIAFAVDGAGNGYCAGYQDRSDLGHGQDAVVVKTSPAGAIEWTHEHNDDADGGDGLWAVAAGLDGEVVIAGFETSADPMGAFDAWVRKLDENGDEVWTHTYDGAAGLNENAEALVVDAAGNVIVGGYEATVDGGFATWVRKLDGDGNPRWTDVVDLGEGNDRAIDADVWPDGRIVVTGYVDLVGDDALNHIWVRIYAP